MKYELGKNYINTKKTKNKLSGGSVSEHESMQFIENYFIELFDDNLDLTKLHFYAEDPKNGAKELTADQAVELLNTGYPLMVKHDSVKETVPFMKRKSENGKSEMMYSGQELTKLPKHPNPINFNAKSFLYTPKPKRPGFFANLFGKLGFKNKTYETYQEYLRKAAIVEANKDAIAKYEAEKMAYEYVEDVDEGLTLAKRIDDRFNPKQEKKDEWLDVSGEMKELTNEEVLGMGNLNFSGNEVTGPSVRTKAERKNPNLSDVEKKELQNRKDTVVLRTKKMEGTRFFNAVKNEIRGLDLDNKEVYKNTLSKLESMRKDFVMEKNLQDISTKEYLDTARTVLYADLQEAEASQKMEMSQSEMKHYHVLSEKEMNGLSEEEKSFFVKMEDNTYIDKVFYDSKKQFLTVKPLEEVNGEIPSREDVNKVLDQVNEKRNEVKDEIARTITAELLKSDQSLKENEVFEKVRFGTSFRRMTASARNLETFSERAKENPVKTKDRYVRELNEAKKKASKYESINKKNKKALSAPKI